MEELKRLLSELMTRGWTYAAMADELGIRWDSVRSWHLGTHSPRASHAIMLTLQGLKEREPPPKRRYGPDAPQRQPKKELAGSMPRRVTNLLPNHHRKGEGTFILTPGTRSVGYMAISWEQAVLEGIAARASQDQAQWQLGDLALQIESVYGEHTLEKYAEQVGVEYHQLRNYKGVSKAYEIAFRTANLTWTHHERVASHPDRLEWLQKSAEGKWSVRKLLEELEVARKRERKEAQLQHTQQRRDTRASLRQEVQEQRQKGTSEDGIAVYLHSLEWSNQPMPGREAAQDVRHELVRSAPQASPPQKVWEDAHVLAVDALLRAADRVTEFFPAAVATELTELCNYLQSAGVPSNDLMEDVERRADSLAEWLAEFKE